MNEIEVVVDVRQSPDSAALIVSKQKLVTTGEFHPSGPPVETRLDLRNRTARLPGPEAVESTGIRIHRRAQPMFDTLPEPERCAVVQAIGPLRGVDPGRWPPDRVRPLKEVPDVYLVHVSPELSALVVPAENRGVEVVDIVRRSALEQFDNGEPGGGRKA